MTDTVALMGGSVDTIDTLVQKLYGGHLDSEIGAQNVEPGTRSRIRHQRAQTATIAISAAFLAKEKKVRALGVTRYRNFLYRLFRNAETNWFAIQKSNFPHVLTFLLSHLDRLVDGDHGCRSQ